MAMSDVHSVCTRIHDLIQNSGLHFVISQTPWSSYITIRRKFVNAVNVNMKAADALVTENEELKLLRDAKEKLEEKIAIIEEEKVHLEEEIKASVEKYENTVCHLNAKINTLEKVLEETELDVKNKKSKIENLEKETKRKNGILQNMNAGFNQKVADLNKKVEYLEQFKKGELNKEKKVAKKNRQKTKKETAKSSTCDINANESKVLEHESDISQSVMSTTECNVQLSPTRRHAGARQLSSPPSPHTPPGLPTHHFSMIKSGNTPSPTTEQGSPSSHPSSRTSCSAARPPCLPSLSEPCSPRTPPGLQTGCEDLRHASDDIHERIEPVSSKSNITVQTKLQEAIDGGTKLSYDSLVALLDNHPWEERKESFEEHDENEYGCLNDQEDDYYEDTTIEQQNN